MEQAGVEFGEFHTVGRSHIDTSEFVVPLLEGGIGSAFKVPTGHFGLHVGFRTFD